MLTPKRILVVMGILVGLFILAGCSSNPITSTQSPPPVDNNTDVPMERGSDYDGYHDEPNSDNPKYQDEDIANQE